MQDYCHQIVSERSVQEQWTSRVKNLAYEQWTTMDAIYEVPAIVLRYEMTKTRAESSGQGTTE